MILFVVIFLVESKSFMKVMISMSSGGSFSLQEVGEEISFTVGFSKSEK